MYLRLHSIISTALLCLSLVRCGLAASVPVTEDELHQLSDNLWLSDVENRPSASQVQLNYQQRVHHTDQVDRALKALFTHVDESLLERPTYAALLRLYPFYKPHTGQLDTWSNDQRQAADDFLDAVVQTGPMRHLMQFMDKKGMREGQSSAAFKEFLRGLWFDSYSRAKGVQDSSGFEHVFMDEQKMNGEVGGLHNWVRVYTLEQKSALNYAGYDKHDKHVASLVYRLFGQWKSSSMFMLTSPEYDLSVYTMCYLFRQGKAKCRIELPDCTHVTITTFNLAQAGQDYIGSAYASPAREASCTRKHVGTPLSPKAGNCLSSSLLLAFFSVLLAFLVRR